MKCTTRKTCDWQDALINAVTDPKELLEMLELDQNLLPEALAASNSFALKVPRSFIQRMEKGNANDPLLKQVLPIGAELHETPGYSQDPLEEKKFNPLPGLLHKYRGRVLLTLTSVCGINCRFCFRRHFAYDENNPGTTGWHAAMEYIANDTSITEVILSGGDPLAVNDAMLLSFTQRLTQIAHVKRLRIHSRMPVVLPERLTDELIEAICAPTLKTTLVIHCNHPREINSEVIERLNSCAKAGIILLNQSVLLKGINDNADTLVALSEALFAAGVIPYYLHVLDKVQGTAHFDLNLAIARKLHEALLQRLSGYLVPKLVCEQAGALSKLGLESREFYTD